MAAAPRYNIWQYRRIAKFVGRRVCEIGSGIGNMSALLTHDRPDLLLLTDTDPYYRDILQQRFLGHPGLRVEPLTLPDSSVASRFGVLGLDTVIALNVIEHIEEDVAAMRSMREMLVPGGRAIILARSTASWATLAGTPAARSPATWKRPGSGWSTSSTSISSAYWAGS